ncbi:uncharacterized protein LOC135201986 [Macrobrachium nipponense]|uniref:uncharacterized protein LOC135201986 n=1 Tax=Macrobrachium nipponense TaxID=159736 RepID=UPI0030C8C2C0
MANFKITDLSLNGFKGAVSRALHSGTAAIGVVSPTLMTVKSNVETLQNRWNKYVEVWDQYISERDSLSDDEFDALEKTHAQYEVLYYTETNKLLDVLDQLQSVGPGISNPVPTQQSARVRLPEVKINSFDGRVEEWQTWWDSFRSLVHDRKDMDKVLKMTQLRSCLKGKALLVVSGFQVTDQDYDDAIAALQDRFPNPEKVKQTLVLQLFDMVKPKNTAKELEQFKLDFKRIIKTLQHYVTDLQSSHWLIAVLLQSKLPTEAEMFIFQKFQTKYFTVDQISTGFPDHLEFLDRMQNSGKLQSDSDKLLQDSGKSQVRDKVKSFNQTRQVLADKTQIGTYSIEATSSKNQCLLCSSDSHRARRCSKYADATSQRSRLIDIGRCSRCSRNKHNGRCLQPVKCFVCNKTNHNEVFSYSNFGGKLQSEVKSDGTVKSDKQVNSTTSIEVRSEVSSTKSAGSKYSSALATAQVKVSNNDNSKSQYVCCFFDPGSHISFITSKLATALQPKTVESQQLVLQGFQSQPKEGQFDIVTPLVSLGRRIKKMRVVIVDELPGSISTPGMHKVYQMLQGKGIKTADEIPSNTVSGIELMVGSDYFADFVGGVTKLTANISPLHVNDLIEENNEQVHKLWELESIGINPTAPPVEDDCVYKRSGSPFKNLIAKSFYADNLQGSMSNEIELLEFYAEANKQLRSANMPLRTWVTNNEKLKIKIEEDNGTVIWSHNEAAIQWVRHYNCKITYVKNRVAEIREVSANYQIFHVSTGENPADLVIRGVEVKDLVSNSLWFKGPSWLPRESLWPSQKDEVVVHEITAERQIDPVKVECLFEVRECSSLEKIFMITKYVFQFLKKLLLKISPNRVSKITLPDPAVYWLRYYQLTNFKETFSWLFYSVNPDPIEFKSLYDLLQKPHSLSVECSDLIKDLGLYFDPSIGLMRSRGRLQHAEIAVNSKYPVLVPPGEHLTNLFILKAHRYNLHGGVQETLATIRRQLWIPKGRQAVRKVIRKCVLCSKVEGKPCVYPGPPSLPLHRVVLNRPFENVGVDYSGPIVITKTEDNEPRKVYICLFTCTATRAVHLDVALDMTAESFLLIFRRFCGTWPVPKQIISDNGTNFKATAKFLEEICNDPQIREYFSNRGIVWKFIVPKAPWQGALYERMIKVVKNCLKKVFYHNRVSLDELQTVVVEIQSRVNNRPLSYINSDSMSPEPLSPSHLLYGRSIEAMPPVVLADESDPTYMDHDQLNKQFSLLSCIISKFEKVWKNEYIISLRERHYGSDRARELNNLKVGDVVLVQFESPRSEWLLGRIVELRPDSEGVIRSVDVYCKGHVSTRTVEKLVPLEVSEPVNKELIGNLDDNVNTDDS